MIATHPCFFDKENVNIDFSTNKLFADTVSEAPPNLQNILDVPQCSKNSVHYTSTSLTEKTTNVAEVWTDNMVKLLIATYSEHKRKFDDPKFTKKKVWDLISQDLLAQGVSKTGVKCDEKWRNLKKLMTKLKYI